MVTPDRSFVEHAGYVVFPRGPGDLTSTTHCPACFSALTSTVCGICHLDLTHPAAAELHTVSLEAAAALEHRVELIGRMRFETAGAPAAPAIPAAVAAPPVVSAPSSAPPVATPPSVRDAAPKRHFGVQVVLLIVGVSLLAVGAVFFLVYAFITFGLVWRSVIIAAVTVAAFVGASLLRRQKLGATAEAIAALAVVFVYLDAFAIRANNLFGAERADGVVYWGATLLASAVVFAVWHRLSGLRLPNIVAFAAAAPGLALLVGGLTTSLEDATRVFVSFAALAFGGLLHPLAGAKRVERVISLVIGCVGLAAGGIAALFLEPNWDWAPAVGLGVIAIIALLHVVVATRVGSPRAPARVAAGIGGVAASAAMLATGLRMNDVPFVVLAAPIAAAAIALALEFAARRVSGLPRAAAVTAAWASAGVAALALLFPVVTSLSPVIGLVVGGTERWSVRGGNAIALQQENIDAVIALAAIVALAAGGWLMSDVFARRKPIIAWAAVAVLILAAPLTGLLWLADIAWLVLGAAGLVALVAAARRGSRVAVRAPIAAAAIVATALAYASSWASIDTWWYGSVGTVALLVVARVTTKSAVVRAILLGAATVVALVAAGSEGWHTNERFHGGAGAGVDATHFVGILAILLVILSAVLARVLSALETRVLFWLSFAAAVVTSGVSWVLGAIASPADLGLLVLPEFLTSVLLAFGLLVALLGWVLLPSTSRFGVERVAASIAIAPVVAWLVDSLARLAALPVFVTSLAPIAASLLVAAVGLAIALLRPGGAPRWTLDAGVALVALPTVLAAVSVPTDDTWLMLLVAGLTALLLSVSKDGLFASGSPRKHLGWVALVLGAAGLWWRLGDARVTALEPYVLPIAGALLVIAFLVWRADRPAESAAAPVIAFAGLAIGVLPIAAVSTTGPVLRTLIVAGAAAILVLAGTFTPGVKLRHYRDAAALAGALGIVTAAVGRAAAMAAAGNTADPTLDAWLGGAFAVLVAAAIGQSRARPILGQVVLGVAVAAVALVELGVLDGRFGTPRAVTLLLLLGVLHVLGVLFDRAPFTALLGWASIALGAVVAVVAVAGEVIDPLEWATGILAAALLVAGALRLRRSAGARSWAWLAPGLLVLLVPSLLATFGEQPAWRLVGLGVACLIAIVAGALLKLQAPLLVGAVVVIVHALRTFAPQLAAVYQLTEWWVWAVVGGAIILFLGLTFEKRLRDLKSVGTRVASLR
ncbi:MAG: hypothetical protein JWP19_2606 [Rhodoglobus sp.]|nr:hypothetical protein [Rhodoglobus sp.]